MNQKERKSSRPARQAQMQSPAQKTVLDMDQAKPTSSEETVWRLGYQT